MNREISRPAATRRPPQWPLPGASAWGEDRYGLWLEIEVERSVQRLRWIEPGEFLMGSPPDEQDRFEGEGPQHRVRLTRGFWLADTACTQQLWQAVVGSNPSRFADDARQPVEQVSWDDVQQFLAKLRDRLPETDPSLPSEAEWEYACRAGTTSAYHWGATITPQQANYGKSGGTPPVKSHPPNDWGLYEMHGNVWEWCADGLRRYEAGVFDDPRGPDGDGRVVRGGSWHSEARRLRSACRDAWLRGGRSANLGFRFALRSISP